MVCEKPNNYIKTYVNTITKIILMRKLALLVLFVAFSLSSYAQAVSFAVVTPPCNNDGVLRLNISGLTPPITVNWTTMGTTAATITHTVSGTYLDVLTGYSGGPVFDAQDRAQETQITLDNVTGATSNPPHFETHKRTHVVRYFNPDDHTQYIDSELIDELQVVDPNSRAQETQFTLNNPQTNDAQADPSDPEISDTANGIDAPWRTDPFQNIIGFGAGGSFSLLVFGNFHEFPSGGDGYPNFDARVSMGGWSTGDTWSGLPTPSGQGFANTASGNVGEFAVGSTFGIFFTYTVGSPVTGYPGWNDAFAFTIKWANKPPVGSRTIIVEQTYNVSGATFVHAGQNYHIAGTAPGQILFFNRWTDDSTVFPPPIPSHVTTGNPVLYLLMVPTT